MTKRQQWFWFLMCGVFGLLAFTGMALFVMPSMYYPNTITVHPGQTIVLNTNGTVEMVAYTSEGKGVSTIYNATSEEKVLTTKPGLMPGYYDGKATVGAGKYTVSGSALGLQFNGENFVSVENPDDKIVNLKMTSFCWVIFMIAMFFIIFSSGKKPSQDIVEDTND